MVCNEKLKALIHYICYKCEDSSRLGATKLNKILWFADSFVYKSTGRTISGSQYKKLPYGLVPVAAEPALVELQAEGKVVIRQSDHFGKKKKDFIPFGEPDIGLLDTEELKLIDDLIVDICDGHTAKSISELSHDIVWEAAGMGEEIPIYAVLAAKFAPLEDGDFEWAESFLGRASA